MLNVYNLKDYRFLHPFTEPVYVGRPTKWGNPFQIGQDYQDRILTRKDAVEAFEDWLLHSDEGQELFKDIGELAGKDLICWCSPFPCHADILMREANRPEVEPCALPEPTKSWNQLADELGLKDLFGKGDK